MEKRLKDYFSKTSMGAENVKEISKNIRSFIKDKYNVEVETKKKHSTSWFGGSVTGENIKEIFIDINSKEKFDLVDFLDNFNECKFVYDNSSSKNWGFSIMPYYVNLYLNNVKLNVGERFNTSFVDVNMILAEAFDNISREEYFSKNRENLTNLYNEKIKENFINDFNIKFKVNYNDIDFLKLFYRLTNGTMNPYSIVLERNNYINENLTKEECEDLNFIAKHMRLKTSETKVFLDYLIKSNPNYEFEILKDKENLEDNYLNF